MIAAAPLVQEPRPTLVGERVNSQGSRKAKELLLADDYDGLLQVAEDQVEGGAHVLDVCVALTERQDEDEQMRQVVKKVSLTQPAPIQVDSTEPDVIERALDQIPGRAIVNSVNLEAGRDKLDKVVPIAMQHGAALIALTIDEVGMAKTRERKLEVAKRITELVCDEHGMDPELLIFDALTFTLTTGDDEWKPSAIETIEGIRLIKSGAPRRQDLARRLQRQLRHRPARPARSSTPSSCTTAWRPGSTSRWSTRTTSRRTRRSARRSASSPTTSCSTAATTRSSASSPTTRARPRRPPRRPTRPPAWSPRRPCTGTSCAARRRAWRPRSTPSVEKIGAVPTLNDVLLPAMKEVGDKFGAGELILPFVLQSAEVMKKAVAQLEKYLDKLEGYTKGTVVLATVFGDVHDIGKSLVNTILTNNGYSVVDLGKQVPIGTILDAAQEHDATAIGLSALLVSTSKQMPLAVQELHERGLQYPVLVGGAAINRDFGRRILYPKGQESDEVYDPGVFYCKDAFAGLAVMDQLVEPEKRTALVDKFRDEARKLREKGPEPELGPTDDESVRSAARTDVPIPAPPFWGVQEIAVDLDEVFPHLDTHVLFKLHWGGRGKKGEEWRQLVEEEFQPRLERMWREQDYLHPRALLGYFPCNAVGNSLELYDPEDPEKVLETLVFPRQPGHDRICLTDFYRPKESGERDVVAIQAVTAGPQVTELMAVAGAAGRVRRAALHARARRPDRGGHGRVAPRARALRPRHPARPGPPLVVGLPGLPGPVRAHEGLPPARRRDDRPLAVGRPRGRARAVDGGDRRPPPAGRLLRHEVRLHPEAKAPDEVIKGTEKDPSTSSVARRSPPVDARARGFDDRACSARPSADCSASRRRSSARRSGRGSRSTWPPRICEAGALGSLGTALRTRARAARRSGRACAS